MQIEIEALEGCKRNIKVTVPKDVVDAAYEQEFATIRKESEIPGFRRGKAPLSLIKSRYGSSTKAVVMRKLLEEHLPQAFKDKNLTPISEPEMKTLEINPEGAFFVEMNLEVLPEVTLTKVQGLEIPAFDLQVTGEGVEKQLMEMQKTQAEFEPVEDTAATEENYVALTLRGTVDGAPMYEGLPKSFSGILTDIDGLPFAEEIRKNVVGMEPGETRQFTVSETHGEHTHTADLTVRLLEVKKVTLPPLDDEFAKSFGEGYETLDQLKEATRQRMEKHNAEFTTKIRRTSVLNALVEANPVELPDVVIQKQLESNAGHETWSEEEKAKYVARTIHESARFLLVKAVADQEKIDLTDEEFDAKIEEMSTGSGLSALAFRLELEKNEQLDDIREQMKEEKVADFLLEHAVVKSPKSEGAEPEA